MKPSKEYLTQNQLIQRGWTLSLIRTYLGTPDKTAPNRRTSNPNAAIKFFAIERVEACEAKPDFQTKREEKAGLRRKTKSRLEQKIAARSQSIESMEIPVPRFTNTELKDQAIMHYKSRQRDSYMASHCDDSAFLERIMVNFLRHECTPYDLKLAQVSGEVGADEARNAIKLRVLKLIAQVYPELQSECDRQSLMALRRNIGEL